MARTLTSTPRQDGFRMPGEFEPHIGCWMLWPERSDNWRSGARPAQRAFAAVAAAIAEAEPVTVCVSRAQYSAARGALPESVRLVEMSSNDSWIRDCGPTFLVGPRGEVRGVDWSFNAWGGPTEGLYARWDQDDLVGEKVLELERDARYAPSLVLEGGSIEVDGEGTLVTTEQCLLNPNRNPGKSRSDVEWHLREYLGVDRIIWLGAGVYQDETAGHVDNLCRFVRPGVVVLTWTDDERDPQHAISRDAQKRLASAADAQGRALEIHTIHQPDPLHITEQEARGVDAVPGTKPRRPGDRMPASYVNFYIGHGIVVMPSFDDPRDAPAREAVQALFPGRRTIAVPSREILLGGGGIHCITLHEPLGQRSQLGKEAVG
jgi:agmatine deiminase